LPANLTAAADVLARILDHEIDCLDPEQLIHYEMQRSDDGWQISVTLDPEHPDPDHIGHQLRIVLAAEVSYPNPADMSADFTLNGVPVHLWHQTPREPLPLPDRCATCPTELANGVPYFRLWKKGSCEIAVICEPCRELMHRRWAAEKCPTGEPYDDHNWWDATPRGAVSCAACGTARMDPHDPATALPGRDIARIQAYNAL
jgi:hypothetical protein